VPPQNFEKNVLHNTADSEKLSIICIGKTQR